jgi:predicted CDP-diglyceride synthetase/phosphatidate cytidylyltransferase
MFFLTFLSNYPEMNYFKIYLELFELEILFRDLTQVFTLTNKNIRRTTLKENKNKLLENTQIIFFITQIVYKVFSLSYLSSTLPFYL